MAAPVSNSHGHTALLCNNAETFVLAMHLSPEEQLIIRNCVSRYATPDTFSGWLNWLVFRMTNAFTAFLGKQSEWQSGDKNVIHIRALAIAKNKGFISPGAQDELHKKIQHIVYDNTLEQANALLKFCFYAQDMRFTIVSMVINNWQAVDFVSYMDNVIGPIVQNEFAKASKEFFRLI